MDRAIGAFLPLETESDYFFGAGIGAEMFVFGPVSLRAEYNYVDRDVSTAVLSLAYRFGGAVGASTGLPPPPQQTESNIPTPSAPLPEAPPLEMPVPQTPVDADGSTGPDMDGDGVSDDFDQCGDTYAGYPVRGDGCSMLNGVLSGIKFDGRTSTLSQGSFAQLDYLANLLQQYPQARIRLVAHTDSSGNRVDQANITRSRLRTIGTYLVRKGVSAKRFVLKSMGGEQPIADNSTTVGIEANNRIEVFEQL